MIVALHIAYHLRWDEIVRFKCLVRVMPNILSSISDLNQENSQKLDCIRVTDAIRLVSFHLIHAHALLFYTTCTFTLLTIGWSKHYHSIINHFIRTLLYNSEYYVFVIPCTCKVYILSSVI